MEIHKRTGQGRGEYEIAGSVDGYGVADLYTKELVFELGAFGQIRTGVRLLLQGGKPRLRRIDGAGIHVQRQIETILLLPKSIRDERQLVGGEPVLLRNRYVLRSVNVRALTIDGNSAICRLGEIDCVNGTLTGTLDFEERLQRLVALEGQAHNLPDSLSGPLRDLFAALRGNDPIRVQTETLTHQLSNEAERVATEYDRVIIPGGDVLPLLLEIAYVPAIERPPNLQQIDPQDVEIRRRAAIRWRLFVERGPSAVKFRKSVRNAYRATCVVCGIGWPSGADLKTPGVDAAHILPWAEFDLDVVPNGLCLCKQHHWAFDQLLLAVVPDSGGYRVGITDLAERAFSSNPAALDELRQCVGVIPNERLPLNKSDWPSAQFLARFYEGVVVTVL